MSIKPKDQEPHERIKNFKEVSLGYTKKQAIKEAKRCKLCGACIKGCPVNINIPEFIQSIQEKNFNKALNIIKSDNILPAICGRVCPQKEQCEAKCILDDPINIGALERFVADNYEKKDKVNIKENDYKVAVIGSGPAGLTAASELRLNGFKVVVYEALHKLGGVLRYGIPNFRLPDEIIDKEIEYLKEIGVKFQKNYLIGKTKYIEELVQEYDAVLLSTGAGLPRWLNIPGENSVGVYFANELLTRVNLMKSYKFPEYHTPINIGRKVVVVGGGNVAMDSARVARRLKADVTICYRRKVEDMPARNEEIEHAKEEGIIFKTLLNPVKIINNSDKEVIKLKCEKMKIIGKRDDGRNKIKGTAKFEYIECDNVIEAIGQKPNKIIQENVDGLKFNDWGAVIVDKQLRTTKENVWAAGDLVSGSATVIKAMGEAKKASKSIIKKLGGY